jgi:predicted nucleotide-binding protein
MARKPLEQVSHPLTNQDVQENRNNTSRQLRSMDQQLANDAENTASNNAVQQEEYHKVIFIFNGIRVPVQVDVRSLRQALMRYQIWKKQIFQDLTSIKKIMTMMVINVLMLFL